MRVALYGGSFNPPHLGHQLACAVALASGMPAFDEVWMVPTFRHAFDKPLAHFDARVALCELAVQPFGGRVKVSRIEEALDGPSYTLHTVRALLSRHPGLEIEVVIGSDLVEERTRWHEWPILRELVSFMVIGRAGAPTVAPTKDRVVPIDLPAVSSTEVRRRLAAGESTLGLLDERVRARIDADGLYRSGDRAE
jgi:nicotinate-nucleotide adenylyltransferase